MTIGWSCLIESPGNSSRNSYVLTFSSKNFSISGQCSTTECFSKSSKRAVAFSWHLLAIKSSLLNLNIGDQLFEFGCGNLHSVSNLLERIVMIFSGDDNNNLAWVIRFAALNVTFVFKLNFHVTLLKGNLGGTKFCLSSYNILPAVSHR